MKQGEASMARQKRVWVDWVDRYFWGIAQSNGIRDWTADRVKSWSDRHGLNPALRD